MDHVGYWQEQVCLVTGSSRGIGKEIALKLASKGSRVAINYARSEEEALKVRKQCIEQGAKEENIRVYKADVSSQEEVIQMIGKIEEDFGQSISILVNNAGHTRDSLILTMTSDDWRSVMGVHLDGTFYCSKAAVEKMVTKRFGRIINMASVSGIKGTAGQTNYSAAKAGIIGFTKALARELGKRKITVNALALGVIDSDMTAVLPEELKATYKAATALKRFGTTSEVATLVEYLAGPDSSYITGQVITMDGGLI